MVGKIEEKLSLKLVGYLSLMVFLLGPSLQAQTVAALAENDDYKFRASRSSVGTFIEMVMDDPSGDGTSESDPFETFIPIDTQSATGDVQDTQTTVASPNNAVLPFITSGGSSNSVHLRLLVAITNNTGDTYTVQAAGKNGSSWEAFKITPTDLGSDQYQVDIDFGTTDGMCAAIGTDCSNFISGTAGGREDDFIIYIFARKTVTPLGDAVDPSSGESGGIFYKVNMSDKVPTVNLTLSSLTKGDKRLTLNFSGGASVTNMSSDIFYKTIIYDYNKNSSNTTPQTAGLTISAARTAGGDIHAFEDPKREGAIAARDLTNGRQYNLAVALVNKYQFANPLSVSLVETPIEIEALLEKQACYLMTAGFQQEHYVLDYFRHIRDHYLLKTSLGTEFVEFYYRTAPEHASTIYNSATLSALVRGLGYAIFYVLKVYPILLFLLGMGILIRFKNREDKQYGRS